MNEYLTWNDLSDVEKEQATNTYLFIREIEEERNRCEVTEEYPEPMNWEAVKDCKFQRRDNGYIDVII